MKKKAEYWIPTIGKKNNDIVRIYKNRKGEYVWKRTSANGQIVHYVSEGYKRLIDCRKNFFRSFIEPKKIIYKP